MPFVSSAQRAWMFANKPAMAKEWASKTPKGAKLPRRAKRKAKIGVDNKLKGSYGVTELRKGKQAVVKINVKAHKGDKAELASTIKHELMHVKHPKMTEKEVYKRTAKTKISPAEQAKLVAKLRHRKLNYKTGAIKRKLKINHKTQPGELISRAMSKENMAIIGLI